MSWIVNERENDWSLTWLNALIVTNWDDTNWDGIPDMIPVDWLINSPIGSDPDETVNDRSSPSTVGVIENRWFLDKT